MPALAQTAAAGQHGRKQDIRERRAFRSSSGPFCIPPTVRSRATSPDNGLWIGGQTGRGQATSLSIRILAPNKVFNPERHVREKSSAL